MVINFKLIFLIGCEHGRLFNLISILTVTAEQKKSEEMGVTEDDVNEIKQDISSFRFELIDILRNNGMKTGNSGNRDAAGTQVFHFTFWFHL